MVIGSDEPHLYDFVNQNISGIVGDQTHWVFRYEIWSMEHSRHFLYRWLFETASGQAYCGREPWSRVIEAEPKLMQELRLLTEKSLVSFHLSHRANQPSVLDSIRSMT